MQEAGDCDDQHEVDDEALMIERPAGQVEALHFTALPLGEAPASRTRWPSRRVLMPAVTTTSPSASPLAMMTLVGLVASDRDRPQRNPA